MGAPATVVEVRALKEPKKGFTPIAAWLKEPGESEMQAPESDAHRPSPLCHAIVPASMRRWADGGYVEVRSVGESERAMASAGQTVVNNATGERVVFRTLARDSDGALLRLDVFFPPGAGASAVHIHPHQEERFEILEGTLRLRVGREERVATAGDIIVVPAGTPHRPRNVGEMEVHCVAEFRPALNIETFFENAFALLSAGGSRTAVPMAFELAELLSHYPREVQATPAPVRLLTKLGAPIGKALGYGPRFPIEA